MGESIIVLTNLAFYFRWFINIALVEFVFILIVNAIREKVDILQYCKQLSTKEYVRILSFVNLISVVLTYILYLLIGFPYKS